jgi:Domain of unknown function (DUF4829)
MKRNLSGILACLLVFAIITACSTPTPSTVEVTRVIPQTVLASQIVKETVVTTLVPAKVVTSQPQSEIDPKYFEGIILITQYYTFLGNGLYEKAYDCYSESLKPRTKEEFVQMAGLSFKSVEIVSVIPYFIAVKEQGGRPKQDSENIARFAVQIRAWGEGNMSGSIPNGNLQYLFLELVKENENWKINAFSTAPFS